MHNANFQKEAQSMHALLQRVAQAQVVVDDKVIGQIQQGLLVLLCAEPADTPAIADKLLAKILKLRIFSDEAGKMNRSVQDVQGGLLVVSQFTLAADTSGGNRPSFTNAAPPALGRQLYEYFVAHAKAQHGDVQTGEFAADMKVHLVNEGPVTIPMRITA
jgi:D-aminoacyl-tRNA deacylase